MDIEKLKDQAAAMCVTHPHLSCVPRAMLRILDAFEKIRRCHFAIVVDSDGFSVVDDFGEYVTDAYAHPLAALLAATEPESDECKTTE